MLSKKVKKGGKDWDQQLPFVQERPEQGYPEQERRAGLPRAGKIRAGLPRAGETGTSL